MWAALVVLFGVCGCASSLNENQTAPQLPRQFRLSLESMNKFTMNGRFTKQYYDFTNKLYRVDSFDAAINTEQPKIGKGPLTDIRNLTDGVSYRYSTSTKLCANYTSPDQCTPRLIHNSSLINWQLKTSCGILSLYEENVPKVYAGNQTVRNALCDVWTSTRKNWPEDRLGELVFKWFFLRNPWMYNNQKQIPLRLEVDGHVAWNSTLNATIAFGINFFAFETNYWTDDFFKLPENCLPSGRDAHDDEDKVTTKMYSRKHVVQMAALTGIICIAISTMGCGIYNFCTKRRSRRSRFY